MLRPFPLAVGAPKSTAVALTTDGLRSWRCGDVVDFMLLTLASANEGSLEGRPNPADVELLLPLLARKSGNEKKQTNKMIAFFVEEMQD